MLRAGFVGIGVLVALAAAPAGAGAFGISSFSFDPSTTKAAGHPDVKVSIGFRTGFGEDARDLTLDFPPGLIGNPETKVKCSQADFSRDNCTTKSKVGTATAIATALGIPLPVPGTVYVLKPSPTDAATLGVVLRATGNIPLVGKIFATAHISVQKNSAGDYFLRNTINNLPTTATAIGFIPVPITLAHMTLDLNHLGNTSGTFFLTNPTSCQSATAAVSAVSYDNQSASAQSSYTPTNCGAVPFTPGLSFATTSTQAGSRTGLSATLTVPGNEQPLRQSHIKSVLLKFPPGLNLDILSAFAAQVCSDADFAADTCPAFSDIGDASAAVTPLPPDFTGDVYRVTPGPGDVYAFGVLLRGPRGVKAALKGGASITSIQTTEGFMVQLLTSFPTLPQIPFTSFRLSIMPLFFNSPTCGTRNAEAVLGGWSGAGANLTNPYTTTGC